MNARPAAAAPEAPRRLAEAGASFFAASVASLGLGFLTSVVVARALGPERKGALDLVGATIGLGGSLLGLALLSALVLLDGRDGLPDVAGAVAAVAALPRTRLPST